MRGLVLAAFLLLTVPTATAEFGAYGDDGWPIAADGTSTNPFPGMSARELTDALAGGDPLNRVGDTTVYPYWPILSAELMRMAADHPDRVRVTTAGKSTLGLDLYMVEIADFDRIDAGEGLPLEEREVVWVDGGHHSNEYSGVYFTLAWAQYLVEGYGSDPTATWIVENRHTWIMPMVNPDGSHAMGRLNARGVNINRNYPVIWGSTTAALGANPSDAAMNNAGPSPASEVETVLNIEWFNLTRPDYYASIHCCGNLWLYPYGLEGLDPVDNPMLQKVCDEAFPTVREDCGPIWSTIYPAGGSSVDTAYEYTGTVAFGYEMSGRGAVAIWGQPLTTEAVRTQEVESWDGLLHAFLNVHRYGAYPNVTAVAADGDGLLVTVRNDGLGNLTGGSIELMFPTSGSSQATIPSLRPGDEAQVRVACDTDGLHELRLSYPKRLEPTTNQGLQVRSVQLLAHGGDVAAQLAPADFTVERSEPVEGAAAPGLAPALLVLALAAVALARRK